MRHSVELVGIGNYVSLSDAVSENRLFIRLPNGKQIESVISDEDLAAVVECFTPEAHKHKEPEPTLSTFVEEVLPTGESALVFGGVPSSAPVVQELAPIVPVELPKRKGRLLGKDSAGNPIVEIDGVDPSAITGTDGIKDEDGVAQL